MAAPGAVFGASEAAVGRYIAPRGDAGGGLQVWDKGASPTPLSEPFPYLGASCCSAWSSQLCLHVCGVIMTEKDAYDYQVQSTAHPPMPIEHIPQCHVSMVLEHLQGQEGAHRTPCPS